MKLKYYLRGLGIGMAVTALILGISFSGRQGQEAQTLTDEQENSPEIGFMGETVQEGQNNNEKILEMHKQGKSTVAIAKELGLGVGEVKLVIDLYKA